MTAAEASDRWPDSGNAAAWRRGRPESWKPGDQKPGGQVSAWRSERKAAEKSGRTVVRERSREGRKRLKPADKPDVDYPAVP